MHGVSPESLQASMTSADDSASMTSTKPLFWELTPEMPVSSWSQPPEKNIRTGRRSARDVELPPMGGAGSGGGEGGLSSLIDSMNERGKRAQTAP
jgi:hypothetical protein